MKEIVNLSILKFVFYLLPVFIFTGFTYNLIGQDEEEIVKERIRLGLSYEVVNNKQPSLMADAKVRIQKSFVPIEGLLVDFYFRSIDDYKWIGSAVTDENGIANLPLSYNSENEFDPFSDMNTYYAESEDNALYFGKDSEPIDIKRSFIELSFDEEEEEEEEEDAEKIVRFFIKAINEDTLDLPVEDVEVSIFVQRLFGKLPIAEYEYTDDEGIVEVEFPNDIPGDVNGNLSVVAKVEFHPDYGTLTTISEVDWGIPTPVYVESGKRELWSAGSNSPLYLVVIVNGMVILIWSVIFYMFYTIFRIRQVGIS